MYSLSQYCDLWNYYRHENNDDANENNDDDYRVNNNKTTTNKSFQYKTKIIGSTPENNSRLDAEVVVPLKYFEKFLEISRFDFD